MGFTRQKLDGCDRSLYRNAILRSVAVRPTFPMQVRRGSVVVRILHQKSAGVFTVAYCEESQRRRQYFSDLADARDEADNNSGTPGSAGKRASDESPRCHQARRPHSDRCRAAGQASRPKETARIRTRGGHRVEGGTPYGLIGHPAVSGP